MGKERMMAVKILKGLVLACIFGGFGYIIFKDVEVAIVCGMIIFMSLFVKKQN